MILQMSFTLGIFYETLSIWNVFYNSYGWPSLCIVFLRYFSCPFHRECFPQKLQASCIYIKNVLHNCHIKYIYDTLTVIYIKNIFRNICEPFIRSTFMKNIYHNGCRVLKCLLLIKMSCTVLYED